MKANIRGALDQTVATALKPISSCLAIVFAIFVPMHLNLLQGSDGRIMAGIAAGSSAIFAIFRIALGRKRLHTKQANPAAFVICVVVITNILAHFLLCKDLHQPVNLIIVIIGAGLVFTSRPWLVSVIVICVIGWILGACPLGFLDPNTGVQLGCAIVLSLLGYTIHVKSYIGLEEARLELLQLSLTDALTGLKNRRAFDTVAVQELKLARRTKEDLTAVYIDMDNMKPINDKFGHEAGDAALKELSQILESSFRESDLVARMGGDEFCVLINGGDAETNAAIERLNTNLTEKNSIERLYQLQLSIGTVKFDPQKHQTPEDLLKDADAVMYAQKQARKRQPQVH